MLSEHSLEDVGGVGSATARKLREAGYATIEVLAVATAFEISEATGIGYDVALRISQRARELVEVKLVTADEVLKRKQLAQKITTGSKALDKLLGETLRPMSLPSWLESLEREDSVLPHPLRNRPAPKGQGWPGGRGFVHRY
ncbi:MAG: helix-hairpin-helix domain-containing protein [Nitrososphaeria archaeon]